jgi:hypothetical protein
MGKYIIELERGETAYKTVDLNGTPLIQLLDPLPYTEPDTEQVREEAYEDGYKTAKVQCNIQAEKDLREVGKRHYQKGLSDAWETARKIGSNSMCSLKEIGFDFGQCVVNDYNPSWFVVKNYSASECIEKIRQYEESKEKHTWICSVEGERGIDQ